jgi:NADH-quinone oxidoreductase subunit A
MAQYLPVAALLVLAALFGLISLVASKLLAPNRPTEAKYAPYECGIIPGREPPQRFPVRFYLVAMLFIVFDIEIIFLYPYAMVHGELGLYGLTAILLFSALVFESFVYLISKGALDWGPLQVNRRQPEAVGAHRTSSSTVRRVGMDGRIEQTIAAGSDVATESEHALEPTGAK